MGLSRRLEVGPNVLQRWRREFRQGTGNAFPVEIDFLKRALQHVEEQRLEAGESPRS